MGMLGDSVRPIKAGQTIREPWISRLVTQHNAVVNHIATDGATFVDRHGVLRRRRSFGAGVSVASDMWVRISGIFPVGTNRWWYTGVQQELSASGVWTDKAGGTQIAPILNGCEAYNDGAGIEGNGVNVDGEAFTTYNYSLRPLQGNVVVHVRPIYPSAGEQPFWVCTVPNAIDGSCE